VLEIKISEEFDPKQETSDQSSKMVPSTTKPEDFYVKPNMSLEDKVYLETYYHHNQANIEVDETSAKIQI